MLPAYPWLGGAEGAPGAPLPLAPELSERFPLTTPQGRQGPLRLSAEHGLFDHHARPLAARCLRVGVVLSGGPAPGGHNVIWGIVDALLALCPESEIYGFLGGPAGILAGRVQRLDAAALAPYRNSGGFDLLGTSRSKIDTPEKLAKCHAVLDQHDLDGLVIIGGDDSNTNAAVLAEYLWAAGSKVRVIGVPKTIDGDLQNEFVETSFGFDSAVRCYSEMIANISRDALSTRKYYHFIRLMGRSASHITLEAALQTQPTLALIAEEVAAKQQTLHGIIAAIGAVVQERAVLGKDFGVILVPEGLIEFIPEMKALIDELNAVIGQEAEYFRGLHAFAAQSAYLHAKLSPAAAATFAGLPADIQKQLLHDRDPHGNVALSRVETEKLLIEMLAAYLRAEKAAGRYGGTFGYQHHFLGYEGRCVGPTNFDADYAYSLGYTAAALVAAGATGYMAVVQGLAKPVQDWQASGVPLLAMMGVEMRHGRATPVIRKALVATDGAALRYYAQRRADWAAGEHFRFSGPIQYFGPSSLTDRVPLSLMLERGGGVLGAW